MNNDDLARLGVQGNFMDRIAQLESRVAALERYDARVSSVEQLSTSLGTMASNLDYEGENLADPSWTYSTSSDAGGVATTSRMLVSGLKLMEFMANYSPVEATIDPNGSGNKGYVKVLWYDDPAAGTLINTDELYPYTEDLLRGIFPVPGYAQSVVFEVYYVRNSTYAASTTVDQFVAREVVYENTLTLDPIPHIGFRDVQLRIAGGLMQLSEPGMKPVATLNGTAGSVGAGVYHYVITYTDGVGETKPSAPSDAYTAPDGTHSVSVTARMISSPGVVTINIYRTLADAGVDGPYYYVGSMPFYQTVPSTFRDALNDSSLDLTRVAPDVNTTSVRSVLPTSAIVHPLQIPLATGSWTRTSNTTQILSEYHTHSGSAVTQFTYPLPDMLLDAGRYNLTVHGVSAANRGYLDYYLNEHPILIGQDWYTASTTLNVVKTVQFTIPEPGLHRITMRVNGHHASSSGYYIGLSVIFVARIDV